MFGGVAVFIVVAVYSAVVVMFAALLMPWAFCKQPLTPDNVVIGLLACLLVSLCLWMILTP